MKVRPAHRSVEIAACLFDQRRVIVKIQSTISQQAVTNLSCGLDGPRSLLNPAQPSERAFVPSWSRQQEEESSPAAAEMAWFARGALQHSSFDVKELSMPSVGAGRA
eukprot:scaffold19249_cov32-Tisochrysis_lutea.AAC.1